MDSVIIRCDDDFNKINENTKEIEFYEYDGLFDVSDLQLDAITFTKMDVDMDSIPSNIRTLNLFDCCFDIFDLNKFKKLEDLEITNKNIDVVNILNLLKLRTLNLNFCTILNVDRLCELKFIEKISLIDVKLKNFNFLLDLKNIKSVVIDVDDYVGNKDLFLALTKKGVLVSNMMGGIYSEI